LSRWRPTNAAAAAPNSSIIGGAGTSVGGPPDELEPPEDELLEDDELLDDEDELDDPPKLDEPPVEVAPELVELDEDELLLDDDEDELLLDGGFLGGWCGG